MNFRVKSLEERSFGRPQDAMKLTLSSRAKKIVRNANDPRSRGTCFSGSVSEARVGEKQRVPPRSI
jgi:hypothetical protein